MSEFIKITKNGEVIEVHPDALANHKELGWVVVEDVPAESVDAVAVETVVAEKPVVKPAEKKGRK
jgi:hypothetical protein